MMRLVVEFEPKSVTTHNAQGHRTTCAKCGDLLTYCIVTGQGQEGCCPLVQQPMVLIEFSIRKPMHPLMKLLQNIRHTYARFPGEFHLAAMSMCSTYMLQTLYVTGDDLSLIHMDTFCPLKVDLRSHIEVVGSELRDMVR